MPARKRHPLPAAGAKFSKHYQDAVHHLEVVKIDGQIAYKVKGKVYPTPSAAAKSLTNNEVNGWTFWGMS